MRRVCAAAVSLGAADIRDGRRSDLGWPRVADRQHGERHVAYSGKRGTSSSCRQSFESLATHGRILRADADRQPRAGITDQLRRASQRDLEVANQRAKLVRSCLDGSPMPYDVGTSAELCVAGSLRTGPPSESSEWICCSSAGYAGRATGMRSCRAVPAVDVGVHR